jgi:hypothetical protein
MELQGQHPVDTLPVEVVEQIEHHPQGRELVDQVAVEMELQVLLREQQTLEEVVEHLLLIRELAVQVLVVPESLQSDIQSK